MEENKNIEPENTGNQEHGKEEKKSSNTITLNKWYLVIGFCVLIILGLLIYIFIITSKKEDKKPEITQNSIAVDSTKNMAKVDSTKTKKREVEGDEEAEETYTKCYVIANSAYLRTSPGVSTDNTAEILKFGDVVYAKHYYSNTSTFSEVYKTLPASENTDLPKYYITSSTLVEEYSFKEYKSAFSLSPFSQLDSKVKKLILDNDYSDGVSYSPTQNSARAAKCVAFGDFDSDGLTDTAVMVDNTSQQSSRLLVICINKATKEPYLAYSANFSDYYMIRSFKKGARIYKDTTSLIPSTIDGLILYTDTATYALVLDNDTKKYIMYNQEE